MEIFNQYFYDLNQFRRLRGNDTIYADMVSILEEKISLFEVAVGSSTVTSWGIDGNAIVIPDEVYRLSEMRVGGFPIEILPTKEFNMVRESPLTAPTARRPIARRDFRGLTIKGGVPNNGFILPSTHNLNASYIRKPKNPKWTYVIINEKALWNPDAPDKQDFELNPEEQSSLVVKILKFAGVSIEDYNLAQSAGQEEIKNIQQKKS
jgi:hypothetical protein